MGTRQVCRVIVLGSTGSIGTQTLEVIEHLNGLHARGEWETKYEVVGLAAGTKKELLSEQAARFNVRDLAIAVIDGMRSDLIAQAQETRSSRSGREQTTRFGDDACESLVRHVECDLVVAAMSGVAGLPATMAAVEMGLDVALANKETLVAAGALVVAAAKKSGARLLPVDSEHSGLWQCLGSETARQRDSETGRSQEELAAPPMCVGDEVARVVLTASGGPFRTWTREQLERATPEQALKHPTWSMGKKVSIDSATLMNKALEIIEAHWLFGLPGEKIAAMVHPQSVVHAMVEFCDGSVVAQLASPDMKLPIQNALTFPATGVPRRAGGCARRMKWDELRKLEFEEPDLARFPGLGLAQRAIAEGNGVVLNAANEAAVEAFLGGKIGFLRIAELVGEAMEEFGAVRVESLEEAMGVDGGVKGWVGERVAR